MLFFVGVIFIALGLLSGTVLVGSTVGLLAAEPGLTLWLTFPSLCIAGFLIVAMQTQTAQVRIVSLVMSGVLLMLALASIVVLVLASASLLPAPSNSAALWFVLVVGLVLGSFGAASFGRTGGDPKSIT